MKSAIDVYIYYLWS